MAFLILDLDETVMYVVQNEQYIHPAHQSLSSLYYINTRYDGAQAACSLHVINPLELSELISLAFTEHSGVMILTSGCWSRDVLHCIAAQLPLRAEHKERFVTSHFYSPFDEIRFWLKPAYVDKVRRKIEQRVSRGELDAAFLAYLEKDDTALMIEWIRCLHTKSQRLDKIKHLYPDQYFLMLDNELRQVQSFASNPRARAVLATTDSDESEFYTQAQFALFELEQIEQRERLLRMEQKVRSEVREIIEQIERRRMEESDTCLERHPLHAESPSLKATPVPKTLSFFKEAPILETSSLTFAEIASL